MSRAHPGSRSTPARRAGDAGDASGARRRASRSLWAACEARLAAAEPRALSRALDHLSEAFDFDGVALHVVGSTGELEPWCARGAWRTSAGDLRDCVSVPLLRGPERVGSLDL